MPEILNPNPDNKKATQPPLFGPDGKPSQEVREVFKAIQDEKDKEFQKLMQEATDRKTERRDHHAP